MKSSKSSKFKSTKRYRRRKVRENNKNKHGIDKNSNHRVTQKVWRLEKDRVPQEKHQYQEKDKNMHSMTSRRQQGHDHDDITKVKTLQDATLKASRLYGMMRDFIHNVNIPAKINYQKIHSKWRNVKKQVQVGGIEPGAEAVPVDDKDCLELPPKLSLHVTAHPDNPKKFILERLPGDPLIHGSLTHFAEGLMGHLDKLKTVTEFDTGDADILARIAYDLILLILGILGGDDDDDDDDDDGEERRRLLAAALQAEWRNAAAAAIIIALIGLIKEKGGAGSEHDSDDGSNHGDVEEYIESVDNRDATIRRLLRHIRELKEFIEVGIRALNAAGVDKVLLRDEVNRLREEIRQKNEQIQALRAMLLDVNEQNEAEVDHLQHENQELVDALGYSNVLVNNLRAQIAELEDGNDALAADNNQLRQAIARLWQELGRTQQQNGALQEQLQERNEQLQAQRAANRDLEATNAGNVARIDALQRELDARTATVGRLREEMEELHQAIRNGDIDKQQELDDKQRELAEAQRTQAETQARIQHLEDDNARQAETNRVQVEQLTAQLTQLEADLAAGRASQADVDAKQLELDGATQNLQAAQDQIADLGETSANQHARIGELEAAHGATKRELDAANKAAADLQQRLDTLGSTSYKEASDLRAEIAQRQEQVKELTRRSEEENAQLREANAVKDAELKTQKATSKAEIARLQSEQVGKEKLLADANGVADDLRRQIGDLERSGSGHAQEKARLEAEHADQLRIARELTAEKERINQESLVELERKDAKIESLTRQLEEARAAAAAAEGSVPPTEVVDDGKLRALQDSLRDELEGAATSATENLNEVFGTGSNAQQLIAERKRCVETNKAEISRLIQDLTLGDALQTTDAKPVQTVITIKNRIQLIREMCKSKLRTFIVQRGGGDSFIKDGAMITKKPVEQSKQNAQRWGPFSEVYNTPDNEVKFKGIEPLIDDVPNGKVVVIFGYGYSGSGKTYTLFGNDDTPGIAQLAIEKYARNPALRVHFRKIRELYNCTYQAADGTKPGVKSEFYYRDPTPTDDATFLSDEFISDHRASLTRQTFNDTLKKVETARRIKGHIFPTHNNPQSSRGHLFVELKVQKTDGSPAGHLIFCDMGGREDPNEMWSNPSYKYCSYSKLPATGEPIIPGPIVRGDPKYYYNFPTSSSNAVMIKDMDPLQFNPPENERAQCNLPSFKVTTYQAVTGSKSDIHTGLSSIIQGSQPPKSRYKSAAFIMKTLREAFYINDSINHLLDHFEYYETPEGKKKKLPSNWDKPEEARKRAQYEREAAKKVGGKLDEISVTRRYYPDIFANISQTEDRRGDPIGMKSILNEYYNKYDTLNSLAKNPDHIRYCTFACIRTEKEFEEDSENTLRFASQVNSCKNADCDAAACSRPGAGGVAMARGGFGDLGGGAKTRRNRSQGKNRTQRRRIRGRRIVKPKSHPVTAVTTQRRNMRDKKKGHRTRKMK